MNSESENFGTEGIIGYRILTNKTKTVLEL
jgi:hypothetical protein